VSGQVDLSPEAWSELRKDTLVCLPRPSSSLQTNDSMDRSREGRRSTCGDEWLQRSVFGGRVLSLILQILPAVCVLYM
jgi:hypothetical protein